MAGVWRRQARETLVLGLPIAATQLLMMGLHITDMVIVGRLGVLPFAAAGLAAALMAFFSFFCGGVMSAVPPAIATARGAEDFPGVARMFGQGILLALLISLPIVLLLGQAERLLLLFGQEPALAAMAGDYLAIKRWYFPLFISMQAMRGLCAVMGRPMIPVWLIGIAFVLNALLAWWFVHGLGWGLTGAAWSTAIIGCLNWLGLAAVLRFTGPFAAIWRQVRWRPDWQVLKHYLAVGLPSGLTNAAELGLFSTAALMMGWIGPIPLAAHEICLQAAALSFMVAFGIAQAGSIRVGQAVGRGDAAEVRQAGFVALHLTVIVMSLSGMLFWLAPTQIIGLFLGRGGAETAQVLAVGTTLLGIAAAFQIFDGAQVTAASILRGLKDTRVPMLIALFGYWGIGLPVAAGTAFWLGWQWTGIWVGLACGLASVAVALVLRFERLSRISTELSLSTGRERV